MSLYVKQRREICPPLSMSTDKLVGLALLSFGALAIVPSTFYESTVLAFIGLTLVFWGCLFLLVLPGKHLRSEVMAHMSSSSLSAIDQIITDLRLKGKPVYVPVPRRSYVPYQIGVRSEFVYVPESDAEIEIELEQAFMKNPKGLRLIPLGLDLTDLMEKKSGLDFHDLDLSSIAEVLPSLITRELEIAENFKMTLKDSSVHTEMEKAACQDLCEVASKMEHICPYIGCPVTSSIACILTRVTNKPIILERCLLRKDTIEAEYQIWQ